MKTLHIIRNYLCYCGIEKDEYNAVKRDAYASNFKVWRILHCLMSAVFAFMFVNSVVTDLLAHNRPFYLAALIYSVAAAAMFFVLHKESIIAQFLIYLSISLLLLFGCLITGNNPDYPATTFIVMILITPMFMIDKPYFMGIVLAVASTVFLVWMHGVKNELIWQMDLVNIIVYSIVGFLIHVISNSIRIKEFVLTRRINIQKDVDELTGLKNKAALTREINAFLTDGSKDKGILFILDLDKFKNINDSFGHDVGDAVIRGVGAFLNGYFKNGEIVGRFGGDEYVFFIKDTDGADIAAKTAGEIVSGIPGSATLPDPDVKVGASIGIALYHGEEKNYSELFKKADTALYEVKSEPLAHFKIYE
ncbi:MAG: GGDEF domain-containing protein [Clostridia bacterium]|nr:GGDEF domain-containing protein [Clostridia bacterium]